MKAIVAFLLLVVVSREEADALTTTTTSSVPSSSSVFSDLQSTPLMRASDDAIIPLTSQWRSNTPFGIADETAVIAFLRHFG